VSADELHDKVLIICA